MQRKGLQTNLRVCDISLAELRHRRAASSGICMLSVLCYVGEASEANAASGRPSAEGAARRALTRRASKPRLASPRLGRRLAASGHNSQLVRSGAQIFGPPEAAAEVARRAAVEQIKCRRKRAPARRRLPRPNLLRRAQRRNQIRSNRVSGGPDAAGRKRSSAC